MSAIVWAVRQLFWAVRQVLSLPFRLYKYIKQAIKSIKRTVKKRGKKKR